MTAFMSRLLAASIILLLIQYTPTVNADGTVPYPVVGTMKIAMVEGWPYDRPAENSPSWTPFNFDASGVSGHVAHDEGIAWVVFHFDLPTDVAARARGLLITNPADADEIYLNGSLVTSHGYIGREYKTAPRGPRMATVPAGLLRPGENEMAMKMLFAGRNSEVFRGAMYLGSEHEIESAWRGLRTNIIATEAGFLAFFLVLLLVYGFLILNGVARTDFVLFTTFIILNTILFLLDSNLSLGIGLNLGFQTRLQVVLPALRSLIMLSLVAKLSGREADWGYKFFFAVGVVYTLLCVTLDPLTSLYVLNSPYRYLLAAIGIYYLVITVESVLRGKEESIPVLVGVAAYAAGSRVDLFLGTEFRDYGVAAFSISMLYALMSRHARLNNRLIAVSSRLLEAHEEERKRIARDIHDGIGQSLAGLKLRTQMIAAKLSRGATPTEGDLNRLVRDTSVIIEDVRRTAMDLRPSFVEKTTLRDAIAWYAESFLGDGSIKLNLFSDSAEVDDPSPRVKEGLYRIVQEVLSNAVKHSGATRVDISLHKENGLTVVTVLDNGRGFDTGKAVRGLGLETMSERAELLGGRCVVESTPGVGTKVRVEVKDG